MYELAGLYNSYVKFFLVGRLDQRLSIASYNLTYNRSCFSSINIVAIYMLKLDFESFNCNLKPNQQKFSSYKLKAFGTGSSNLQSTVK